MPFSYAQYAGNGSATTFSVPFPYLLKAHVKLFYGYNLTSGASTSELVDGVGFTWTSGTQVQTTVAPAVGQTLTIVRQTPSDALVVQWQDGSNLVADDLQDSSLQNLYSVQEQEDVVSLTVAQSATAATSAAAAVTTANAASTTANSIAGTANTALSNSSAAVTTANAASATATAAQTTANGIAGTANTASSNASAAVTTANAANATANSIAGTANTALSNSSAAVTTADAASTTANGIAGTANTALTNANAAVTTANAASTTANGIAGTANTALTTANAALPKAGGTMTGAITFAGAQATATTSAAGIVQLSNSTTSISETLAATPKAIKDAKDVADAALPKAGGTMTGALLADDSGTAASPAIAFDGDTNTGVYRPAPDEVAVATAGTERIRFGASGQIGLGGATYGTAGHVLTSNGASSAPSWAAALPAQSGNSGKYLGTNGTSASWSAVAAGANMQVFGSSNTFYPTSGKTTFLVMVTGGGGAGTGGIYGGGAGGAGGTGIRFYNATELGANASVVVGGGGTRYYSSYWGEYFGTAGGNSSFDPAGTGLTLSGLGGGAGGFEAGNEYYYPTGTGGGSTNSYWAMNGYGETPFWGPGPGFAGYIADGSAGIVIILEW